MEAGQIRPDSSKALSSTRRNVWSGILFGLGLVAFLDETVFHQLLHWHHFYDKSTTDIGLVSDGLFHAFSWFATIGSSFMLAALHRQRAWKAGLWWGGVLLGGGAFQLYDGIIQHKLMRLHQIRYVDNVYIYDWIWNLLAAAMIIAGITLLMRARQTKDHQG
ncbi:DUF2243 domain-containing protein [Paenibacillus thiaminolyticus]|uniref:DUF2243 domain-containing protein n=1 Tax=Paenibacillus thiaminolyticus TaxID=49283 RepID=UPI002542EA02|nr:DUF2243 domain-containing protein [Paenibacillus thiaminolyticus]WII35112.1 DUF2243 domain-containing protein [Paenibacillus thiaminolyticus]